MRSARAAICALACGLCGAANAENRPLPDLFDVTGVAAADALNVRSAPDAQAEIIGALDPDTTDVEITAIQGGWGRVNQGERSGWAAMRFLARQDDTWIADAIPPALVCFGTEPFWSLGFEDTDRSGRAWMRRRGWKRRKLSAERSPAMSVGASWRRRRNSDPCGRLPGACSDGMSDRAFGLTAAVILDEGAGPRLLHGCCSIAP